MAEKKNNSPVVQTPLDLFTSITPEVFILTTAQQLSSIIKSARDIMRKDKGLNGDLDRLPMLTWIMFLKFLDDTEKLREIETSMRGQTFRPIIDFPYRWRDWAADEAGFTGEVLMAFINNDEAMRVDGTRGTGLFTYLRNLQGDSSDDRHAVVSTIFRGTVNRMVNGYLLRDVINRVNSIHFASSVEIHSISHLYESMLKEMRDAAGDSGEFYTPRPVVRLMVEVIDPRLGETVLDPACGTGGFLVETYKHLEEQCQTVQDYEQLQKNSIYGGEAKTLPYLLAQMNLLLHGMESPKIDPGNSLRFPLKDIEEKDRVDIILTNPPFGGEEERGILSNFPLDKQTDETALLFLQFIMRKLKRPQGRAAVIVPNGVLYGSGAGARIRQELLENFNLHTIVRLPKGVFEPYADIPSNILFFDASHPTKEVWFYHHPLPPERARLKSPSYSQSNPLEYEEFLSFLPWLGNKEETPFAWHMSATSIAKDDYNLDQAPPRTLQDLSFDLEALRTRVIFHSQHLQNELKILEQVLANLIETIEGIDTSPTQAGYLDDLCFIEKGTSPTQKTDPGPYKFVVTAAARKTAGTYQFNAPAVCIPLVSSTGHGHASIHRLHYEEGQFALANIMVALLVKPGVHLVPKYLYYYLWRYKEEKLVSLMKGTANTSFNISKLKSVFVHYPDEPIQRKIVEVLDATLTSMHGLDLCMSAGKTLTTEILGEAFLASFPSSEQPLLLEQPSQQLSFLSSEM